MMAGRLVTMAKSPKCNIYSIKLPTGPPPRDWLRYRPDLKDTVKYGDLVENINISSADTVEGLYVVGKDRSLVPFDLEFNAIPLEFEAFTKFPVGYHFKAQKDPLCKHEFTETIVPVPVIRDLAWVDLGTDHQYASMDGYLIITPKGYKQNETEYYFLVGDNIDEVAADFKPSVIDMIKKLSTDAKGVLLSLVPVAARKPVDLPPEEPSVKFAVKPTTDTRSEISKVFEKYGTISKILLFGGTATVNFKEWNNNSDTTLIRTKLALGEEVMIDPWLCTGIIHKRVTHSFIVATDD